MSKVMARRPKGNYKVYTVYKTVLVRLTLFN